MKNSLHVVGIMNGTSIDGADFVLCKLQKSPFKCTLVDHSHSDFSDSLSEQLRKAARHELRVDELAKLHHDLGRYYAKTLSSICRRKKWKIDLIGVHGQTVFHSAPHSTLQIGEASYLRAEIGVPVVSDFRSLDLAYGGQGAPIASVFHRDVLARKLKEPVAIQNLGGIGNVSYFNKKAVFAFDTGPANMLIDIAVQTLTHGKEGYDRDGKIAASGIVKPGVIGKWLAHSYFSKNPPKSCGREEFGETFLTSCLKDLEGLSVADTIATLTEFTARSIADAYAKFLKPLPTAIVLCGGGAKNKFLKSRIQFFLEDSCVITSEDLGWPVETVEGAAFALLAAYRVWGITSNIPQTTGASAKAILGKLL